MIALATLVPECSSDRFETAAEGRPLNPNFVLYYAIDVNADDGDDEADGGVKRLLIGPFWDCRADDMFLY